MGRPEYSDSSGSDSDYSRGSVDSSRATPVRTRSYLGQEFSAIGQAAAVTVTWRNLSYTVSTKKGSQQLLHNLCGIVKPGQVLACMGPSGAGKSTFLNCLANRITSFKGDVHIDGAPVGPSFQRIAAYVMQDDALVGSLTVRENMMYSARLRLPSRMKKETREKLVDSIIHDLGLDRVKDSKIGTAFVRGISGGERRRASTGVELVTDPSVLYLDEPTSGLDSAAAEQVVKLVKKMARKRGIAVMMTIHQPSSSTLELFDIVQLLSRGRNIYFGPERDMISHFDKAGYPCPEFHNPADHYIELINTDFEIGKEADDHEKIVKDLIDFFKDEKLDKVVGEIEKSDASLEITLSPNIGKFANGLFHQTMVLTERNLLNIWRYFAVLWIRIGMYAALAIMMGTIWLDLGQTTDRIQDRLGAHFFSVAFLCFMAVAAIPAFIEDRIIFERERANGAYATPAYVISNTLGALPITGFIAIVFSALAYFMIGLNDSEASKFFNFVGFLYLALMVAESMMVALSAFIPYFVVALAGGAGLNGLFMATQGFFVRANQIPNGWIWAHYISYQKYSFEAILSSDLDNVEFLCVASGCGWNPATTCHPETLNADGALVVHGKDILCELGYEDVNLGEYALILLAMIAFWRILFAVILSLKKHKY